MNKFRQWYMTYSNEITWFVIGMCVTSGIDSLAREQYGNAILSFFFAWVNFVMNKKL